MLFTQKVGKKISSNPFLAMLGAHRSCLGTHVRERFHALGAYTMCQAHGFMLGAHVSAVWS